MSKRAWILAAALAAIFGTHEALAAGAFKVTSSTFKDGERLATKFAGNVKSNPNCVGENISPALSWANPPDGTKSYAILMVDVDGRPPSGFTHWVAYGIPASVTGFAEGEVSKQIGKFVGGQNAMKLPHYFGPCAPPGSPHHYVFTLMATDLDPAALKEGMTRDELIKALETRTGGFYKPSPGVVYPALTFLEDVGYATVDLEGNKKRYQLSEAGRAYLDQHRARLEQMVARLQHVARKMDFMRRAMSGQPQRDVEEGGWAAELVQARGRLKQALMMRSGATADEQRRIAAILERAADEIERDERGANQPE